MINKEINYFSKLPKEEKLKILIDMLKVFEGVKNIFGDFYNLLNEKKQNLDNKIIISIYSVLIKTLNNFQKENIKKESIKFENIKTNFQKHKFKESSENKSEIQELEDLINTLT